MPVVANTLKTYDQVGKKEDIEDIIYDISPTLTPFTSSIGTSSASATLHQWQQSELAAVGTNAAVEGALWVGGKDARLHTRLLAYNTIQQK